MPLPGANLKYLILLLLGPEPGAEGVDDTAGQGHGSDHGVFHGVFQIVVRARNIAGHYLELVDFDDAAAHEVLGNAAGFAGQLFVSRRKHRGRA